MTISTTIKRQRKSMLLAIILLLAACDLGVATSWWGGEGVESVRTLPDFTAYQNIIEKKKAFFDFLRPIIVAENDKVRGQRKQMLILREQLDNGKNLSAKQSDWLLKLAAEYRIEMQGVEDVQAWKLLKRRVDTVPFRLALAQAANESSWGTSRFAKQGFNLFGQWCFTPGCGIVPAQRQKGLTHEVAAYTSVNESVAAYIRSINRVQMYTPLRTVRHSIRTQGEKPTAIDLARELSGYSERGDEYVTEIQGMIRKNYDLMTGEASLAQSGS